MNTPKGITKYYIGFGVLMLFLIFAVTYVFSEAGSAKTDKQTDKTVEQIANKLETKIAETGEVPATLEAAGITDAASTVTYTKLSSTQYKVCVDYKTASSGFDAGWGSLLLGGAFNSGPQNYNTDHTYFDSSVEFNHKKGQNCQTVTPYTYSSGGYNVFGGSSKTASSVCENPAQGLVSGDVTVNRIDSATKTIYFDAANQYVYDKSGNLVPTISSKQYSDTTVFCNSRDLSLTTISAVKAGDQITIYLKNASDTTLYQVNTTYLFQ
jgi:hypothetical protein